MYAENQLIFPKSVSIRARPRTHHDTFSEGKIISNYQLPISIFLIQKSHDAIPIQKNLPKPLPQRFDLRQVGLLVVG